VGQRFNESDWVDDIAATTLAGIGGGLIAAAIAPDPQYLELTLSGGLVGLAVGTVTIPIKWLLRQLPGRNHDDDQK
jgi:hypothetical protein